MNGLELVLHEAGHGLLARLDAALVLSARRQSKPLPRELSHLLLFYTVGELVRQVFPDHVPYAEQFGIWRQNEKAQRYRALIAREWPLYLDGRESLDGAIERLVAAL